MVAEDDAGPVFRKNLW